MAVIDCVYIHTDIRCCILPDDAEGERPTHCEHCGAELSFAPDCIFVTVSEFVAQFHEQVERLGFLVANVPVKLQPLSIARPGTKGLPVVVHDKPIIVPYEEAPNDVSYPTSLMDDVFDNKGVK